MVEFITNNNAVKKLQIQDDVCSVSFVYGNGLVAWMDHELNDNTVEKISLRRWTSPEILI